MDLRQEAALEVARQRLGPDLHPVTLHQFHYISFDHSNVFVKDVLKAHKQLLEQWFFWMTTDNL